MKRVIAYLLCAMMFLQGSVSVYAEEETKVTEYLEIQEEEILEEAKSLEDQEISEEAKNSEDQEISEEAKNSEEQEVSEETKYPEEQELSEETKDLEEQEFLEENPDEDPQYGRAHGYGEESENEVSSGRTTYVHDSKFNGYEIRKVIDVSTHQKNIDWVQVKASGIDYAIIRVGFRGYGESGTLNKDPYFAQNMKNAISAGVKVGVYIFSQAITEKEAVEEAEYVLDLISGYDVSLPVVMDYEYASGTNGSIGRLYNANLSKSQATKICRKFCATIEAQGYTPMLYANKNMLEKGLNASEISKDYKIWLARYNESADYAGDYEFWQYTSTAKVNGIKEDANGGNVDMSFWYVDPNGWKNPVGKIVEISDTYAKRLYGSSRYETSFEIANALKSQLGISKFSHIIVADGSNFADALGGSYLAGIKNAPIIMTNGKNAQDVRNYIQNHVKKGGTVYILGGTAAVPEGVGCGLGDYTVKRLQGKTRYETNLAILKEAKVSSKEILVCTGKTFADSLSGSATGKPILLVNKTLTEEQKTWLSSLSGKKFYILGGTGAVSASLENELKTYGTVERIGGSNRYETSVMIAEKFFTSPSSVVLASSSVFADGLCGGPLALKKGAPLILTKTGSEAAAKAYAQSHGIHEGLVLGGNNEKLITNKTAGNILGWVSHMTK